jgi:hypothetical protein
MRNRLNILTSGGFLVALALLIINDHYLKAAWPGIITGKLSDFAGLFVMAVFIYAVSGKFIRTGRQLIIMHLALAAGFIIWKIAPVELLFIEINKSLSIPLPSRIKDPTDLVALTILPVSYIFITRYIQRDQQIYYVPRLRRVISAVLLAITCFAIIATYAGKRYDFQPKLEYQTRKEWPRIRELFQQTLTDHDVEVKNSHALDDSTFIYKIFFKDKKLGLDKKGKPKFREYTGYVILSYSPSNKTISFGNIYGWVMNDKPSDKIIDRAYLNRIITPFLDSMKR